MITKDIAYKKIATLVERFEEQKEFYKRSDYNETLTRRDFIDPFFKALGWDIDNEQGYAESYREVIHEDKIKIGGATKAPDYSFRLSGGKRLFFVEAKKPSVLIKDEITPAYQVRRYGWSAKLSVSIITDFEEFAVYDCTKKPNLNDKASHGRIKYLTYQNYLNEFDFIWDTFSKEKVLKGSFDKFIQNDKQKKGTATVDYEFLSSIDAWRTYLASNIALRNNIDEDELNFVVQHIIDRIIFLRIAEDRGVERYGNLQDTIKNGNYYENLLKLFHTADQKYNSGLFDFKKDNISGNIEIDNKIIKSIIGDLYYPVSPYEFSVISVEILGSAYEQFLGKTISLSKNGRAVVEEKPEVRKAGGVYYTPEYIVDYIVKNTVGKLIEGRAPKDINKIKIVDPACGSGSFLIGAYQYLLQYHKDYYTNNGKPSKGSKGNPLTPDGNLTTGEKKRILLNNIFGVDIDANAVEVTKLSLLLKCMEGETEASISSQLKLFHERVLPTLDNNIKDGNSLIDIDFYSSEIDFGEEKKVKPFSWKKAFPEVFKQGGFDCVVGNPPYGASFGESEKRYLMNKFKNQNYQLDSYLLFLEHSINLILKQSGKFGMIIPNPWLTNLLQKNLRKHLFQDTIIDEIVHFKQSVFPKVTVDTEIVLLTNSKLKKHSVKVTIVEKGKSLFQDTHLLIFHNQDEWVATSGEPINIFQSNVDKLLFKKIQKDSSSLETYFKINVGIKPYQVGKGKPKQVKKDVEERIFDCDYKKSSLYRKYLRGSDIHRYVTAPLKERYLKYGDWLAEPRPAANFDASEKIFMRQTGDSLIGTIDKEQHLCLNNMHVLVPKENLANPIQFYLGVINSKLLNWYYQTLNPEKGEALAEVKKANVASLPIKNISKADSSLCKEIVKLVDQLLKLNEDKRHVNLQSKLDQLQNRIDFSEQRINDIVYELYDLTKDEIALIENS